MPDRVIYDRSNNRGSLTKTSFKTASNIILSATFPGPKVPSRMDSFVAGVEPDHNLAERDNVILAL